MNASAQLGFAALVASLATLLIPVGTALWTVFSPPALNPDGSPDNAPLRGAGFFLLASPVFLLALATYFALVPVILRRIRRLSFSVLLVFNVLPSTMLALLFGIQGLRAFGPTDGAIAFGLFGGFSFISLSLGSCAWWLGRPSRVGNS